MGSSAYNHGNPSATKPPSQAPVQHRFNLAAKGRTGSEAAYISVDAQPDLAFCAYLAVITLVGLAVNAIFHIAWFDSAAALVAIPVLLREAQRAWRGHSCGCC